MPHNSLRPRFLAVYLPAWPGEYTKRKRILDCDTALLLVSSQAQQTIVHYACPHARHAGVRPGMSLALAQALAPNCNIAPWNAIEYFRALRALALRMQSLTPRVALDQDLFRAFRTRTLDHISARYWGTLLDITGTQRIHPCEEQLVRRIRSRLAEEGVCSRIAIAPTPGAAWALSRFRPEPFSSVTMNQLKDTLFPLPVQSLRISETSAEALREFGIRCVGDVFSLPTKMLLSRFGIQLLQQMDRLLGAVVEPLHTIRPSNPIRVEKTFEIPLQKKELLVRVSTSLFKKLLSCLASKKLLAGSFELICSGVRSDTSTFQSKKELVLHTASCDQTQLLPLLQNIIDYLEFQGSVTGIRITAQHTYRSEEEQYSFLSQEQKLEKEARKNFLNRLTAEFGSESLRRLKPQGSHIPEQSFCYQPLEMKQKTSLTELQSFSLRERPPVFLQAIEPARAIAMMPDSPPSWITWRGRRLRIVRGLGPERIAQEWWKTLCSEEQDARDYFRVQDERGLWLWIFRRKSDLKWFVQGVWV